MVNSNPEIMLRPTKISDLDFLFQFQLDKEGGYLAAFMPKDPTDKFAYIEKYKKLLVDITVASPQVEGFIDSLRMDGMWNFVVDPEGT